MKNFNLFILLSSDFDIDVTAYYINKITPFKANVEKLADEETDKRLTCFKYRPSVKSTCRNEIAEETNSDD